jgi:hypothetical protein
MPGHHEFMRAAADCPACVSTGHAAAIWPDLAEPSRRKAGAQAVADHLGFCAHHATILAATQWPPGLASVVADGFGILATMLGDRARYEERLVDIVFLAIQSCPACSVERRHVPIDPAVLACKSDELCFPHYRAAAARADEAQLARMSAGALRAARSWAWRLGDAAGDGAPVTRGALRWLCGVPAQDAVGSDAPERNGVRCPVCRAAAHALERWLESLSAAMRLGVEQNVPLPLCPAHIRLAAAHDGRRYELELVRRTLHRVTTTLARGLDANERAGRLDREASSSVWYRRRAPSYVLGLRRRTLRMPRCGACEHIDLACQKTLGKILDLLATGRRRTGLADGGDLCLRHFGGAYLLCPHGEPRAALAARQRDVLLRAQARLRAPGMCGAWDAASGQLGAAGLE